MLLLPPSLALLLLRRVGRQLLTLGQSEDAVADASATDQPKPVPVPVSVSVLVLVSISSSGPEPGPVAWQLRSSEGIGDDDAAALDVNADVAVAAA